jgi:brefeldin A-inhibited guanine nucleotide-exchange protein
VVELLLKQPNAELRTAQLMVLRRVGEVGLGVETRINTNDVRKDGLSSPLEENFEVDAAERMRRPTSQDA